VKVDGAVGSKAGTAIAPDAQVELAIPDHPYVGRGGVKLAHALDVFVVEVAGRRALDIGASTGGFTDVLLRRGAASVIALDVGRGQLDWRLRHDPRVLVRERVNARALVPGDLPHAADIIVIDVSFISLHLIFPALPALLAAGGDIVALVKPQFEAGRAEVGKGGLVTDPSTYQLLQEQCFCVWLKASPEEHMSRVIAQGDLRPFRNGMQGQGRSAALGEIEKLLEDREKLYARADATIETSGKTVRQSLEQVKRALA
jgi:TlyA family rRNA methyltransferase/putative hemolysin